MKKKFNGTNFSEILYNFREMFWNLRSEKFLETGFVPEYISKERFALIRIQRQSTCEIAVNFESDGASGDSFE